MQKPAFLYITWNQVLNFGARLFSQFRQEKIMLHRSINMYLVVLGSGSAGLSTTVTDNDHCDSVSADALF